MGSIGIPKVVRRGRQIYMGIRFETPFRGASRAIAAQARRMERWGAEHGVRRAGLPFLRYHVIDMEGTMVLSYCIPVRKRMPADGDVKPGELPAGRFAALVYSGGGIAGNRALIEWARAQGFAFDRRSSAEGDRFRARYETVLTDPASEPRRSRWEIEVAIKLADRRRASDR